MSSFCADQYRGCRGSVWCRISREVSCFARKRSWIGRGQNERGLHAGKDKKHLPLFLFDRTTEPGWLVESSRKLNEIFEAKIKAKLDEIWGEKDTHREAASTKTDGQ